MRKCFASGHSLVEVTFSLGMLAVVLTGSAQLYFGNVAHDLATQRRAIAHKAAVAHLEKHLAKSSQEIIDSPGINHVEVFAVELPGLGQGDGRVKVYDVTPAGITGKGTLLKLQVTVVVPPNPVPLTVVAAYKWDGGGVIPAPPVEPEPEWCDW